MTAVLEVPHRLEPFGDTGWTVRRFKTATDAASFVRRHPDAAMPCWRRFAILPTGELTLRP